MMKNKTFIAPLLLVLLAGCVTEASEVPASDEPTIIYHTTSEGAPFSEGVQVGNMLYLAGKLGTVPGQGLVEGGIQAETRQTLENIKGALERFGSSMDQVVKCTVFLADVSEWAAMNEVYTTYFTNKPARSAVGNSGLVLDARVEIECMATIQ